MRPTHSSIGTDDRQYEGGPIPNRRADADIRRLAVVCKAMQAASLDLRPTDTKVYDYVLIQCLTIPITFGESDKIHTIPDNAAEIGRAIKVERAHVLRSVRRLEESGHLRRRGERIWPVGEKVAQLAQDYETRAGNPERPPLRVVSDLQHEDPTALQDSQRRALILLPILQQIMLHILQRDPGRTIGSARAPDQELRNSGEDSMPKPPCVCLPGSHAGAPAHARPGQDDTHTHGFMDDCSHGKPGEPPEAGPRYPWTADELARIEAWSMKHHVGEHVAKQLPTIRGLYPPDWIIPAMKRALIQKSVAFRYIQVILSNWEAVGGPNRGPEADYDDDMNPIRRPTLAPLEPAPARPTASRFPISNSQRVIEQSRRARALIKQGIDPCTGKPYVETDE